MSRIAIVIATLALAGCVEETVDGKQLFADNCASCHGTDARGLGELASGLPVAPPDLTGLAARNGGVFDRDAIMSQIDGLHRKDGSAMPEFGAGDMGGIIMVDSTPIPAELYALAGYLESIQE